MRSNFSVACTSCPNCCSAPPTFEPEEWDEIYPGLIPPRSFFIRRWNQPWINLIPLFGCSRILPKVPVYLLGVLSMVGQRDPKLPLRHGMCLQHEPFFLLPVGPIELDHLPNLEPRPQKVSPPVMLWSHKPYPRKATHPQPLVRQSLQHNRLRPPHPLSFLLQPSLHLRPQPYRKRSPLRHHLLHLQLEPTRYSIVFDHEVVFSKEGGEPRTPRSRARSERRVYRTLYLRPRGTSS